MKKEKKKEMKKKNTDNLAFILPNDNFEQQYKETDAQNIFLKSITVAIAVVDVVVFKTLILRIQILKERNLKT